MGEGHHTAHSRTHTRAPGEQIHKPKGVGTPSSSCTLLEDAQQLTVRIIYA